MAEGMSALVSKYPNIIEYEGRIKAIACYICGANAHNRPITGAKYFSNNIELTRHVNRAHCESEAAPILTPEEVGNECWDGGSLLTAEDMEINARRQRAGEAAYGVRGRTACHFCSVRSKEDNQAGYQVH